MMNTEEQLSRFVKKPNDLIMLLRFLQTFDGNGKLRSIYEESHLSKKEFINLTEKICIEFVDKCI